MIQILTHQTFISSTLLSQFKGNDYDFSLSKTPMKHFQGHWKIYKSKETAKLTRNCWNYEENGVFGMFQSVSSVFIYFPKVLVLLNVVGLKEKKCDFCKSKKLQFEYDTAFKKDLVHQWRSKLNICMIFF